MGFSRREAVVGKIGDGESSRVAVRQPPTPARMRERRGGHPRVAEVVGFCSTFAEGEERDATETRR
jgi:hypothetical protein